MSGAPLPPFLGEEADAPRESARVGVLPFGYEGTVSYGAGAAEGPRALLEASAQVELYDEYLDAEPYRIGIHTLPAPELPEAPEAAVRLAQKQTAAILERNLFPVILGGEHSISLGVYEALAAHHGEIGVIQLDAHADLRETYDGIPYSHACVMARIRERTPHTLHLGIRSLSIGERDRIRTEGCAVGMMRRLREEEFLLGPALANLPEKVFLTFDIDALDLSLVRSTGTPEPGGFLWDEITNLLARIFARKTVVGFDVVELCGGDPPSAFVAARLVQRMIGLRFRTHSQGEGEDTLFINPGGMR